MKARHATALALVGWCLVTPPEHIQSLSLQGRTIQTWTTVSKFESYDDCQKARSKLQGAGYRHSLDFPSNSEAVRDFHAQCVKADDLRVTGKLPSHPTK